MKKIFLDASISSTGVAVYDCETKETFLYSYSKNKIKTEVKFIVGNFKVLIEKQKFPKDMPYFKRYMAVSDRIAKVIFKVVGDDDYQVYIEGYAFAGKGKTFSIGEFGGLLKEHFYRKEKDVIEIPPSEWKKFLCKNGSAPKSQVYNAQVKGDLGDVLSEFVGLGYPWVDGSFVEDIADVYSMLEYVIEKNV